MAGPRRSLAVPSSGQDHPEDSVPRSPSAAQRRSRGVLRALTGTWEGRAVVGGAAAKGAVWLLEAALGRAPAMLTVLDTITSVAVAAGAIWFFVRAIAIARRRLLWRVRRKLVISYIFIGLIPAAL